MNENEKYQELLKEIGRVLKEKNDQICIQAFQISDLRKKLETAEKEIEELRKETNKCTITKLK